MNLVVDIGNTRAKVALFDGDRIATLHELQAQHAATMLSSLASQCEHGILCSTANYQDNALLDGVSGVKILLTSDTFVPIKNTYETPETLGEDRVAAAVGAHTLFPAQPCLVIDMGSCITIDFIDAEGTFRGGSISPGVQMRFRAMYEFTARLPLVKPVSDWTEIGTSTHAAMLTGVMEGIRHEIEGYRGQLAGQHNSLKTILTGGDCSYFAERLKTEIFERPNLVLTGLNEILKVNVGN